MLGDSPIARQALKELEGGVSRVDDQTIEGIADCMDLLSDDGTAEGVILGMGSRVEVRSLPAEVPGIHVAGIVVIGHLRDAGERRIVILHEGAHIKARREGFNDAHKDVWRLTLAAAMPSRILRRLRRRDPVALAAEAAVPYWAAWARLKMPCVSEYARAA